MIEAGTYRRQSVVNCSQNCVYGIAMSAETSTFKIINTERSASSFKILLLVDICYRSNLW